MSKRKFRVGQTKPQEQPRMYSPEWTAMHINKAMNDLAPHIQAEKEKLNPQAAIVLIAMQMFENIMGKKWIDEDSIVKTCFLIMDAWKLNKVTPPTMYPYTFEQTDAALRKDSEVGE